MKNIIRPLRILINKDNQRPYIIFKNKKYYVDNLSKNEILNLINKLSKKFKRKKIKNRSKLKKDINKNLTGLITSKIYEGYVNNQLNNKLNNINNDILNINNKINDNKKMIEFVDNNKNKLKKYNEDDLYILDEKGKYRFYINDKQYIQEDDKNKLKSIIFNTYKDYVDLKNNNESLNKLNIDNISKIDIVKEKVNDIDKDIDDLLENKENVNVYINEYIDPILQDIKEENKKKKIKAVKLNKKTSAKRLKNMLVINPDIKKTEQDINENYGEGFKKYIKEKGLYGNEIRDIMKNIKFFLDVININDLNILVDNIINNKLLKCCFIINNNESHWVACYIDLINDHEINYYDSLGNQSPDIFKQEMKRLLNSLNIDVYVKFKENLIKNQPDNSLLCAFYCMTFILQRLAGLDFKYITNYKNLNEKNIKELKQKYDKFKFI